MAESEGRQATLAFDAAANTVEWTIDEASTSIGFLQLVGLVLVAGSHRLYYTAKVQEGDEKEQATILKSVTVKEPPVELLNHFSPPSSSFLQLLRDNPSHRPLQIFVSITAGTGKAKDFAEQALLPLLKDLNIKHEVHETTSERFMSQFILNNIVPSANEGHKENLIVLSGDGGVVDILNPLKSLSHTSSYVSPSLGVMPFGTGNAVATSARITDDETFGLKTLLWGRPRPLPAFKATFSPGAVILADEGRREAPLRNIDGKPTLFGCVVCSWALHAALVADSDTVGYRRFGAERFKMAAKENLYPSNGALPHPYKGRISFIAEDATTDDWQLVRRPTHGYVLATIVSHMEKGFKVNPICQPLDGKMKLVHFEAMSGREAMDIMSKTYDGGKHIEDPRLQYVAIRALRIQMDEESQHWRRICLDGTIVRIEKGGWVEVTVPAESGIDIVTM